MSAKQHWLVTTTISLILLQLFALAGAQSTINNDTSSACPSQKGAHIIVARASTEAPGYGIIGAVKDQVLSLVPGSTAESVGYPATLSDYVNSETAGVIAMRALIDAYITNCPGLPLVIMGYSQGAQVSGDSLVGQQDKGFSDNSTVDQPLSSDTLAQVAAVIMMGDPAIVPNASFHVGNSTKTSTFPRQNVASFDISGLASRTQSYCDDNDLYCASGKDIIVHVSYVKEYGAVAADFVVKQIASFYGNVPTATSRIVGTASASRSASKASASVCRSTSKASASAVSSTGATSSITPSSTTKPTTTSTPTSQAEGLALGLNGWVLTGSVAGALLAGFFAVV